MSFFSSSDPSKSESTNHGMISSIMNNNNNNNKNTTKTSSKSLGKFDFGRLTKRKKYDKTILFHISKDEKDVQLVGLPIDKESEKLFDILFTTLKTEDETMTKIKCSQFIDKVEWWCFFNDIDEELIGYAAVERIDDVDDNSNKNKPHAYKIYFDEKTDIVVIRKRLIRLCRIYEMEKKNQKLEISDNCRFFKSLISSSDIYL